MANCLVTKLNGIVNNETIEKIGEIKAGLVAGKYSIITAGSSNNTVRLTGNAYFSDSTYSENKGQSITHEDPSNWNTVYIVANGYANVFFNLYTNTVFRCDKRLDIDPSRFRYASILRSDLMLMSDNKSSLSDFLDRVTISSVLYTDAFTGDISGISKCTGLTMLSLLNDNISGDLSSVRNLSNLTNLSLYGNITGDASLLPANIGNCLLSRKAHITWDTERPASSTIPSIKGAPVVENLDTMLINMAKCKTTSDKQIYVRGTRTSASDSAISTLQGMGYTVSIEPLN